MVRLLEIQQFSSRAFWELSWEISVQFATLALLKSEKKWGILGVSWGTQARLFERLELVCVKGV